MRYIEDFREDDHIAEHYLCKQKLSLKSRSGKAYLSLRLQDKTGTIEAKVWDLNNEIKCFEENDYIKVEGIVLTYQNELQLKIVKIRKSNEGEFDPLNYIPCTEKDITSLFDQLYEYIKSISNLYIKELLHNIFIHDEKVKQLFRTHSAAKVLHHSYMGGLLEHTLSVTQVCDYMSGRYKFVNRDLLLASAMLHDIGKIYELSDFPGNDYTDNGQLLGHLFIGAEMVGKYADDIPDFPANLKSLLQHCLLSHHGEYEFGSPKRPKTIEAFILHCADNMDAKVKMFEDTLAGDNTQGNWVGYSKTLGRNVRKSDY